MKKTIYFWEKINQHVIIADVETGECKRWMGNRDVSPTGFNLKFWQDSTKRNLRNFRITRTQARLFARDGIEPTFSAYNKTPANA